MTKGQPSIGVGSLVEDIFGLNIRGLRTIRDVVIDPQRVAAAARDEDWGRQYTPSIRLVFFLLTLTGVLRFLWAPEGSDLVSQLSASFERRALEGDEAVQAADQFLAIHAGVFPVLAIIFVVIAAVFLRVWGAGTSTALRIRLHLMVLIPSSAFSVFGITAFAFYSDSWRSGFFILTTLILSIAMIIDFVVAARTVAADSQLSRIAKAFLFASVNQVMTALAATLAVRIAVFVILQGH